MTVRVARLHADDAARAAFLAHAPALDELARSALSEHDFSLEVELSRPFFRACAAWLGDAGERPAGFILAAIGADELHIHSVVVDPRARRLGLGRALARAALEDGAATGQRIALLEVRRSNSAAIRLYRSLDFVAVRVRRDYYADPREDAVEMACELEPGALAGFDVVEVGGT